MRLGLIVVAIGLAWGVMYALYPVGLERSGPLWLAGLRFDAFAIGALAALLLVERRVPLPANRRDVAAVGVYSVLNVVLHNALLMAGSGHVPVAVVGIATGLNPLLTVALARAVLPAARVGPVALAGLASGLAGVGLLATRGGVDGGALPLGWTLVVVGGVAAWSAGSVGLKLTHTQMPSLALAFWSSLVSAFVLQAAAVAVEPWPAVDAVYVGVVLFSGLVGGLGAFLLWHAVVRRSGPQRANLASYVSPVAASLAAWPIRGEALRWVHLVAYGFVAAGLTLLLADGRRQRRKQTPDSRAKESAADGSSSPPSPRSAPSPPT